MGIGWVDRADHLLRRYVDSKGLVDYPGLARERDLDVVLEGIANQDSDGFRDENEALAFYLNAYNFAALAIVCRLAGENEHLLSTGLRGWWIRIRFFLLERVQVAGRRRSLFGLEFFLLRGRFHDARIHFALVCATSSCPPLRGGVYADDRLEEDLEAAARNFMQPSTGYSIDRGAGVITWNRIFKWYRRDFKEIGGPLGALERWGSPEDARYARASTVRMAFARYDWSINRTRGAG